MQPSMVERAEPIDYHHDPQSFKTEELAKDLNQMQ